MGSEAVVNGLTTFGAGACVSGAPGYHTFLGLLPWYEYINLNSNCAFDPSHPFILLGSSSSLLLIFLAIVDDLLRIAGMLAVFFLIYTGVKYIMSQGVPDAAAKARTTGINALVGLAITMVAVSFVSFLGNQVGGSNTGGQGNYLNLGSLPNPTNVENGGIITTVLAIVFGIIGALAFMTIVIGGFKYVLSQGDPQNTAQAKNTIIYAIVGLVIAIVAESIVSLAVSRTP